MSNKNHNYNKSSNNYKGSTVDNLNRSVDVFEIHDEIHLVYNIGESNQYSTKQSISQIKKNKEDYIWTPYIEFVE